MEILGILLSLIALIGGGWYVTSKKPYKPYAISICLIAVFFGIFLIIQDRVIEISVNKVGTIKAAAKAAIEDAEAISKIKRRVENQSATIDLIAQKANSLENKTKKIDQLLLFTSTLISAQNDDRKSFNQLYAWFCDYSFAYHIEAGEHWKKLRDDASIIDEFSHFRKSSITQCAEILNDKSRKPIKGLIEQYRKIPSHSPFLKCVYIIYIADKRTDIPKKERLAFLIDIIKSDSSLKAAKCAGWRFWANTTPREDWLDENKILNYWEENEENY